MKSSNQQIFQSITQIFIDALNEDIIPWEPKYQLSDPGCIPFRHSNGISNRSYRGINPLILETIKMNNGYRYNQWVTFNQARSIGNKIKPGEKAAPVYFSDYRYYVKTPKCKLAITKEEYWEKMKKKDNNIFKIPFMKRYPVFNLDQLDNKMDSNTPEDGEHIIPDLLSKYVEMPQILYGDPAYHAAMDRIFMPYKEDFESEDFYSTVLFHEVIHSTGHNSRLNREGISKPTSMQCPVYAKEELVAEIGAAFLCGLTGILKKSRDNSKAYIQSWVSHLSNNPSMIFWASIEAQKAVDYILGKG